ncbi:uncharacterized protein SAPINGB_P002668 [Magnusiomyces paraingens]|uniref:histidinol-phosphate transaminase n=1 Tax=Magnusiomyces paraingens TaxID=2606893 RepID=A0A5E8BF49_9ASCO|nr:uncharacterized protein SAPINGB_P002668 [Saprochaete ingens]VVT50235.1 unnamed protein product [Saprochaete ingens]
MASFNLETLVRPNILALEPYRCARDDYQLGILLDANENTHGPSLATLAAEEAAQDLNRYPDPHQPHVKQLLCDLRNADGTPLAPQPLDSDSPLAPLTPANICLGVGSDESIDALIRVFCKPGVDKLLTCPPTYGMYAVSAQVNDVEVVKINMHFDKGNFQINTDAVATALAQDPSIKLVYITSPGNPTATLIEPARIERLLNHPTWNGIVIVDEAYIDFAPAGSSFAPLVTKYPNLAVLQTLSKSFGLAGVRLGCTFADAPVAQILNNLKAPYNISTPTSQLAERALSPEGIAVMHKNVKLIIEERTRVTEELKKLPRIGEFLSAPDANFVLVEFLDKQGKPSSEVALKIYTYLAENKQIVVRFRGKEPGCEGALRISIGTNEENTVLLEEIKKSFELY